MLTLVNWNIERRRPGSWQAASMLADIQAQMPDIVCLTEAWEDSARALGGHSIAAKGVAWSAQEDAERKVVLWSRNPWVNVPLSESITKVGGILAGYTTVGDVRIHIIGVCIPYHMARPHGSTAPIIPWQEHERFLDLLEPFMANLDATIPTVMVGDFNRRIPGKWGPARLRKKLETSLPGFEIITKGMIEGLGEAIVDHVAINSKVRGVSVVGLTRYSRDGFPRSDHHGVVARLAIM
jgi:exonuclease III